MAICKNDHVQDNVFAAFGYPLPVVQSQTTRQPAPPMPQPQRETRRQLPLPTAPPIRPLMPRPVSRNPVLDPRQPTPISRQTIPIPRQATVPPQAPLQPWSLLQQERLRVPVPMPPSTSYYNGRPQSYYAAYNKCRPDCRLLSAPFWMWRRRRRPRPASRSVTIVSSFASLQRNAASWGCLQLRRGRGANKRTNSSPYLDDTRAHVQHRSAHDAPTPHIFKRPTLFSTSRTRTTATATTDADVRCASASMAQRQTRSPSASYELFSSVLRAQV